MTVCFAAHEIEALEKQIQELKQKKNVSPDDYIHHIELAALENKKKAIVESKDRVGETYLI